MVNRLGGSSGVSMQRLSQSSMAGQQAFLTAPKVLDKGTPYPPYLFVLRMEVFSSLINRVELLLGAIYLGFCLGAGTM